MLWAGLALAVPGAAGAAPATNDTPPAQSVSFSADAAGSAGLVNQAGASLGRQTSAGADFSFLARTRVSGPWYAGWGVAADAYAFHGAIGFPLEHLQDFAGQLSLEYFQGSEAVGEVVLHPGFYFGGHPDAGSFDIPVEAVTGIPLTTGLSGVLGVDDGRLYRDPVPVVGLVWTPTTGIRVEAIYPEPAVIMDLGKEEELRLAGHLTGGGFLVGPKTQRTRLEYDSYRVGLTYARQVGRRLKLSATAGIELERVFDFYRIGRRAEADNAPYAQLSLEF